MIKLLHIENIAVIEKADIEFTPGLNVMTGETGAGKSIVIDALSAVTGGRATRDVLRTGADHASVTAVFSDSEDIVWFEENGAERDESGEIFLSRRISADGKNVCRVNGTPVSAAQMRDLGSALLDIHGQNDGRKLLDERAHLSYLDAFGRLSVNAGEFRKAYRKLLDKKAEIGKLSMDESERERRLDALKYQVNEIEQAAVRPGELGELAARRELLINASKLTGSVESAFEALYGGDAASGAVALIGDAQAQLEHAARYSDGLRSINERLLDLRYTAQDISDELRDFRSELNFSPGELDQLEARLDVLRRIERKYGGEEKALEYLERSRADLYDIEDSSNKLTRLESELERLVQDAMDLAGKLSVLRKKAALALENSVMDELSQLNMPGVKFVIEFETVRGEYGLSGDGCDMIRFLMSANTGEKPGRIDRIASGGELARIMLALKNVMGGEAADGPARETGAMVFDEIDSGVSGVAAQRVGEKLAKLASNRQVLCVTHLPQIAVMADAHFEIRKSVSEGRTFTHVTGLDIEGRKREVARLSGGENITLTTLTSAAEQIAAAEEYKSNVKCRV